MDDNMNRMSKLSNEELANILNVIKEEMAARNIVSEEKNEITAEDLSKKFAKATKEDYEAAEKLYNEAFKKYNYDEKNADMIKKIDSIKKNTIEPKDVYENQNKFNFYKDQINQSFNLQRVNLGRVVNEYQDIIARADATIEKGVEIDYLTKQIINEVKGKLVTLNQKIENISELATKYQNLELVDKKEENKIDKKEDEKVEDDAVIEIDVDENDKENDAKITSIGEEAEKAKADGVEEPDMSIKDKFKKKITSIKDASQNLKDKLNGSKSKAKAALIGIGVAAAAALVIALGPMGLGVAAGYAGVGKLGYDIYKGLKK